MTDTIARARERAAAATGSPEDRAHVLVDRLRQGVVTPEHIAVAAFLGCPAAALLVPAWQAPDVECGSLPAWVALRFAPISRVVRAHVPNDGGPFRRLPVSGPCAKWAERGLGTRTACMKGPLACAR